tara:strand:- start:5 stop:679 length:675 start_codon:yes stop_codon:yes gene_type:complete
MNNDDPHILVVDDDDGIRNLVKQFLNENNFLVTTAINAEDAEDKIKFIKFDLIVLDVMMPGKNGINFILDNKNIETPIILLTAKGEPDDRIEGLEVGADDYLPKPFEPRELTLRIKKILNRSRVKNIKRLIEFENLKIDLNKHYIHKNEIIHKINSTEKIILENMIRSPGEIFTRENIGKLINLNKERSVDVIITRLRKKIEDDPKNPKYLQTIRGEGYVLWIK